MSTTMKVTPSPEFDRIIKKVLEDRTAELIEHEIKAVRDKVATRLQAELGNLVLSVLSRYEVERYGTTLQIRVENQFKSDRSSR